MQRDKAVLIDIVEAARLATSFVQGFDKVRFLGDARTQSAVLYRLIVIGEAVKRLSPELRNSHPGIPWKLIAGMRDQLIHGYDLVDWDEVWKTATSDVPVLIAQISPLISDEPQ